ncbi:hypothetical protein DAEQUDRAFT_769724 [Daedalea quercina L-15889]|uniref:DNA endonuclease activator Ctp1 C-terminal domain-containing protein n=1 Tax=Daedalea quercina L-15889 TaxID=1314783 RepID=A0A165LHS3_9APHY|nr:hypothetical protein DAEQUDRAFT_769724 [Daedalea quercina L-15889]
MGFDSVEELEAAIAARPQTFRKEFIQEAPRTIEALEAQVAEHIRLDTASREGLADAAKEIDRLTGETAQLWERVEEVCRERDALEKRVKELNSEVSSRLSMSHSSTGFPTPATTGKRRQLPLTDVTPRNASSSLYVPGSAGTVTIAPATPRLPPLMLTTDDESDPNILRLELCALHAQYEALRLVKERAETKYRADYTTWRDFKRWMFGEDTATPADGIVDGRAPNFGHVMKVRRRYMRTGTKDGAQDIREAVRTDVGLRETVAALPDEFEQTSMMAPQNPLTAKLLEAQRQRPSNTPPVQDTSVEASTSAIHSPFKPIAPSAVSHGKKRTGEETLEPVAEAAASSPSSPRRKRQRCDDSSETEEESQALPPMLESQPGLRRLVPMPDGTYVRRGYGPYPQDAEQSAEAAAPQSPLTPRKSSTPGSRHSKRTPTKSSPSSRTSTPRRRKGKERLLGTPTRRTPGTRERLGKENPSATGGRPQDYSAYKGRGRYAVGARGDADTINARYEVNADENNGVGHQFEEVVRDKERRKRLHGADCECCREYYRAVGKLPPRPQAPLWRSPHATPTKSTASARKHLADAAGVPNSPHKSRRTSDSDEDEEEEAAIADHVQQISRHRQQWERPKTPPGYWEIAFPDTQETAAINQQAKEMHEQKMTRIEEEANRGGRYKKRKS